MNWYLTSLRRFSPLLKISYNIWRKYRPEKLALRIVLISTYELGRQPFGLASPAAWLREAGAEVTCLDLAVEELDRQAIREAHLVAFYLPMHTATRIATHVIKQVKQLNPGAHLACYGLYAPLNEAYLRVLGVQTLLGGEFEEGLVRLVERLGGEGAASQPQPTVSLARQQFLTPWRAGLPGLSHYAQVATGGGRTRLVGYTEASRGCKHLCRHCPVVPVYGGQFRVVQRDVVLEDIRRQVAAGAEHITFGDPDFFNGPGHALPIVRAMHEEFPQLTYDVTIKIEHLLKHAQHLSALRETGCLFVTSAVESIDDRVLALLAKGHTRQDFIEVVRLFRQERLALNPTFVTFTPWTTLDDYRALLSLLVELDLVGHVAPIQLTIRLLIPAGSRLLDLPEIQGMVGPFDEAGLVYPWQHANPALDRLHQAVLALVEGVADTIANRHQIFSQVAALAGVPISPSLAATTPLPGHAPVAFLTEPWY